MTKNHTPLLIAHRGDTIHCAENTIAAFESAFHEGADGIELDIQFLKGELIVVHNYLFDIRKKYPTLESVLTQFSSLGRLEIEVKTFSVECIPPLQKLLAKFSVPDLELTTGTLPLIPFLRRSFPRTQIGVIFQKDHYEPWMNEEIIIRKTRELMTLLDANVAHIGVIPKEALTPTLMKVLHNDGKKVHYHIGNGTKEEQLGLYLFLQNIGVDQCTFDDIRLLQYI